MVFNIAMIVIVLVQGGLIISLSNRLDNVEKSEVGTFAYFQKLATDLGYPKLLDLPDDDGELENWSNERMGNEKDS